ncbi:MAG: tetratricopeptide repeat protein [Anaeromicrobium sp.]|uniref:tetratricopeptide repeat protein n=1 Tax=Anaeromicrobium sp. TaxID=1929132 RepID=UPI0025DB45BF|nr:tetratricopeptide repeat protein [Anaeromicrobium sp.]MCT4595162.1 tetratricopeptide repeat protein [Anaeromicrobium sp.]
MNKNTSGVDIELGKIRKRIEFLWDSNKLELLIEEGKNLLSIDPEDEYGLYMLAQAYKKLKKIDEAEAVILEYLKRYEEDPNGHVLYGDILQEMNEYKKAEKEFQRAIDLDPDEDSYYIKLAINLMIHDNENLPKCIKLAEKAVSISPNNGINHSYLAELYFNDKRLYDAQREVMKGLELASDHHMVHDQYGRIQYEFGNIHLAQKHFEELFRMNPDFEAHRNWLNDINYFKENMDEYLEDRIKYLSSAAKAYPEDKIVYLLLSKAYFKIGKKDKALAQWNKHLLVNPENTHIEIDFVRRLIEEVRPAYVRYYLDKLKAKGSDNKNVQIHMDYIYNHTNFEDKLKKDIRKGTIYMCLTHGTLITLFFYIWDYLEKLWK